MAPNSCWMSHGARDVIAGFQVDAGCQGDSVDAVVDDDRKLPFFRE
ncbi:MAG: hypothetical protein VX520_08395 [Planctomycetota bacterium]|nr:hypothetical protein [Planctomycetota bacterium]